tara:strand:- start:371 stop:1345 length:975 start_codon:yes stop_codon:yes gene_type:complete
MARGIKPVTMADDRQSIQTKHEQEIDKIEADIGLDALKDPITGMATVVADSAVQSKAYKTIGQSLAESSYLSENDKGEFENKKKSKVGQWLQKSLKGLVGPSLSEEIDQISKESLGNVSAELGAMFAAALKRIEALSLSPDDKDVKLKDMAIWLTEQSNVPFNKDGTKTTDILPFSEWEEINNKDSEPTVTTDEIISDVNKAVRKDYEGLGVVSNNLYQFPENDKTKYGAYYATTYGGNKAMSLNHINRQLNKGYINMPGSKSVFDKTKYLDEGFMRELISVGSLALYNSLYGNKTGSSYKVYNQTDLQPGDIIDENRIFKKDD